MELSVPSGTIKQSFPAASVVHIRLGSNPDKPHIGLAPWQCARLSSEAMATIEQGIRDEARISSGRVWVAPDGASNQQVVAMANAVSSLKGGKQVVSESTVGGFGQSANAPRADWKPEQVGQAHAQGNALMRGAWRLASRWPMVCLPATSTLMPLLLARTRVASDASRNQRIVKATHKNKSRDDVAFALALTAGAYERYPPVAIQESSGPIVVGEWASRTTNP